MSTSSPLQEGDPNYHDPEEDIEMIGLRTEEDRCQRTLFIRDNRSRGRKYKRMEIAEKLEDLKNNSTEFCAGM